MIYKNKAAEEIIMNRCKWCLCNEKMIRYHDEEWGVPLRDDRKQFEFLMMEVMQCGLNWNMMIQKREIFRQCFENFDYDKVAEYGEADIERILNTEGMIRSRRKIEAVMLSGNPQGMGIFQQIYLELYQRENLFIYRPSKRRAPGQERPFRPGQPGPEKAGNEVYGISYGILSPPGLRDH